MNPPASVFATSPDPITPIFMSFSFERCEDYTPLGTPIADPAGSCRRPRCSSHPRRRNPGCCRSRRGRETDSRERSEEHTSELQSLTNLVCRLLLEKKKKTKIKVIV